MSVNPDFQYIDRKDRLEQKDPILISHSPSVPLLNNPANRQTNTIKFILLLDVDDCAAVSNKYYGDHHGGYRYNDVLFDALLACQIKELYLLTSYTLSGIAKNQEDEPISAPSRLKLMQYLEKKGFVVHGCMTLLDAVYRQGVGAYYERVIKPFETYVLSGENLHKGPHAQEYEALCNKEIALRTQGDKEELTNKGKIYEYFLQQEPRDEVANRAYIFADDRKAYLESVWTINQTSYQGYLLTLLVEPLRSAESYKQELKPFIERCQQAMFWQSSNVLDEPHLELESQIIKLCEPKEVSKAQVPLFGLDEIHYLSLETARKILSQDVNGKDVKQNSLGNSLVTHLGQIFFKRPLISPLIEECVYQTNRVLGGGIVTPTRVLYLKMPDCTYALQASLAVGEVGFDEILRLPFGLQRLKELFGEERLIKELPSLLDGSYYQEWQAKHPECKSDTNWETQASILLDTLFKLPKSVWPKELKDLHEDKAFYEKARQKILAENENLKGAELELALEQAVHREIKKNLFENQGLKGRAPFLLLALIEKYPELTQFTYLTDLIQIPELFRVMNRLYPKVKNVLQSPKSILENVQQILKQFDKRQLCQHVLLALLTEPRDHKGDNFRVKIRHDDKGNLLPLEIVAIDNDDAMNCYFKQFRPLDEETPQNIVLVKTIFLCFGELLEIPFDKRLCDEILALNRDAISLQWLSSIAKYYHTQAHLLKQAPALFAELNLNQFPQGFIQRFFGRFARIQEYLNAHRTGTLKELVFAVEPILAQYYFELNRRYRDPQSVLMQVYKKEAPTIEAVLDVVRDGKAQSETFTLPQKLAKKTVTSSFLTEMMEYIQAKYGPTYFQPPILQKELFYLMLIYNQCSQIKFQLEEWVLSDEVLVQTYFRMPEACVTFLMENCKKVTLSLGKDKSASSFSLHDPRILFQIINSPYDAPLIEILIALGANPYLKREDGYTVLHLAAKYNRCTTIPVLVQAAQRLLEEPDITGRTPLDIALQYENFESARQLFKLGGGQNILVENGKKFIERYRTTEPNLCVQILKLNLELAWSLGIESITQVDPTSEGVCLEGISGLRFLKSEYYQKIFKGREEFPKEDPYGRHNVTSFPCRIDHNIEVGFHLKENPKLPGREIMVHGFAKRLFGYITPPVALWKFSKQEGWWNKYQVAYPVLASRTIVGRNLHQILHEKPALFSRIERQSFSENVILAMLINPADGKFDNYILEPYYLGETEQYRLVSIDNDFSFVRPIQLQPNGEEVEGPQGLQVKTILYCMDLMKEPLHPQTRRRLLNLNVHDFIKFWLEELQAYQIKIKKLFNQKERKALHEKDIYLEVTFKPSIIGDIYQKMKRMQQVLKKTPNISLLQLLTRVIPELGTRYGKAFSQFKTPKERFGFLTEGCFETRVMKLPNKQVLLSHSISKLSALNIQQMTTDKKFSAEEFAREQEEGPEAALARLKSIEEDYARLKNVQEDVRFGRFEHFMKLLPDQQEMVIYGKGTLPTFDFGLLKKQDGSADLEAQRKVLSVIKGIPFRRLRLLNCEALTDEILSQWLNPGKKLAPLQDLISLELRGCKNLSGRTLISLSLFCSNLEKLFVQGMPLLQTVSVNPFPKLRVLYIYDCENLKQWLANTVSLQKFNLRNCRALTKINKQLPDLNNFVVESCDKLTGPAFFFYQQYPQLLKLPLEDKGQEFVEILIAGIETIYLKEGFVDNPMPKSACDWWEKTFAIWEENIKGVAEKQLIELLFQYLKANNISVRARAREALVEGIWTLEMQKLIVKSLLRFLKNKDSNVGAYASEALGRVRIPLEMQREIIESLLTLLKDEDTYVRESASKVLGSVTIPPEMQEGVAESLLALLKDKKWNVRVSAIKALSNVTIPSEMQREIVKSLLAILKDKDSFSKASASETLGKVTIPLEMQMETVESLLTLLKNKEWYLKASVIKALSKVTIPPEMQKVLVESLLTLLKDEDGSVRTEASEALSKVTIPLEMQKGMVESLLTFLKDEEWKVRESAINTLSRFKISFEMQKVLVELLLTFLRDKEGYVRWSASEVLSKIMIPSEMQKKVAESLLELLNDKSGYVRMRAIEGLAKGKWTPEMQEVITETLLTLLKDKEWDVRTKAIEALSMVTLQSEMQKRVVESLLALLKDKGGLRTKAIEVLGKVTIPLEIQEEVAELLLALLKNDEWDVRTKAIEALYNVRIPPKMHEEIVEWLLILLKDENGAVRTKAIEALGKVTLPPKMQNEIVESLLALLEDEEMDVRTCSSRLLVKVTIPSALQITLVESLLALLKDENENVRMRASEVLGKVHISLNIHKQVIQSLISFLRDEDCPDRIIVINVLSSISSPQYLLTHFRLWLQHQLSYIRLGLQKLEVKWQEEEQALLFSKPRPVPNPTHGVKPFQPQVHTQTLKTLFAHVKTGEIKQAHELLKTLVLVPIVSEAQPFEAFGFPKLHEITNPDVPSETLIDAALQIKDFDRRKNMMGMLKQVFSSVRSKKQIAHP